VNVLAIDTATATLGLSLKTGSESHTLLLQAGLKHSEKLMPSIQALLLEAELDREELELIACSIGPGSFTGIRIGLATAKGLAQGVQALGTSCRLIGVSTLDGLARRFRRFEGTVVAVNPSLLQGRSYGRLFGNHSCGSGGRPPPPFSSPYAAYRCSRLRSVRPAPAGSGSGEAGP